MTLTAQDVHDKQFKLVRGGTGYDMDEVDAFLDEVEGEIERLNRLIVEQQEALEAAQRAIPASNDTVAAPVVAAASPAESPAAGAARILEMAQQTADAFVAEARTQGEQLVAQARSDAQAAKDEVDAQRLELGGQIESLRSVKQDIQTKLRDYLQRQLLDIDALDQALAGSDALAGDATAQAGAADAHQPGWAGDQTAFSDFQSGDAGSGQWS